MMRGGAFLPAFLLGSMVLASPQTARAADRLEEFLAAGWQINNYLTQKDGLVTSDIYILQKNNTFVKCTKTNWGNEWCERLGGR